MVRSQLDGHIPVYDAATFPKLNKVAEPGISPSRQPGEHYWVRLTDGDLYVSCLWCGVLRPWDDAVETCSGRPRLDILNAPDVYETSTLPQTASTSADDDMLSAEVDESASPF